MEQKPASKQLFQELNVTSIRLENAEWEMVPSFEAGTIVMRGLTLNMYSGDTKVGKLICPTPFYLALKPFYFSPAFMELPIDLTTPETNIVEDTGEVVAVSAPPAVIKGIQGKQKPFESNALLEAMVLREARASVALDHDPEHQTISAPEGEDNERTDTTQVDPL